MIELENPPARADAASIDFTDGPAGTPVADQWLAFGLTAGAEAGTYHLPANVVGFAAEGTEARANMARFLATMQLPPEAAFRIADQQQSLFRIADPVLAATLARSVPEGVACRCPGEALALPADVEWLGAATRATSVDALSVLTAVEVSRIAKATTSAPSPTVSNPLASYSLRGQSAEFRDKAVEARPLLGDLCLSSQVTVWYAAPNTGKTLIALNLLVDAVNDRRIEGHNVYYINADDGSEGMATKMELMDDLGVHTLTPGFGGFSPKDLAPKLCEMAERDEAKGVLVIIDTTKKFVKLMDKNDSAAFGTACRRVAMGGGAILNLAHTTKSPNTDGTPRYTGTTDIVEDADAAYTIRPLDADAGTGERTVTFECFKRRGDNVMSAAYAYAGEDGVSYVERLASVRAVDPATIDQFKRLEAERADEDVLQAIAACIAEGINTKMVLGKTAAARVGVSVRRAYRLIEQHTGDDPARHRWCFAVRRRGAKAFELLPPAD